MGDELYFIWFVVLKQQLEAERSLVQDASPLCGLPDVATLILSVVLYTF